MKKEKIRNRIEKAIKQHLLCEFYMVYDEDSFLCFPLKMSENLVFGAQEDEFQINGYSIRRMQDIEKVKIQDNFSAHISMREVGAEGMQVPEVDILDWFSVFTSLENMGKIIIVESAKPDDRKSMFAVGRIEKVGKKQVSLRYFGPDGIWDDEQWKIPYEEITSVTFGSRYAEVFSRYLPEYTQEEEA